MPETKLLQGDCLEVMKDIDDSSIDAIVTDPPYELGFMGKKWDTTGIAYNVDMWKECLRVLKPGGHLLSFGGFRTYHRMACAVEDAGFEIRDMIEWVYNSGFPKSQNIAKGYDKKMGNKRGKEPNPKAKQQTQSKNGIYGDFEATTHITKGNSQWEGFGTALKPAHEPIVLARKPLSEKTIVDNCIKHGTGALDIDSCRIPTSNQDIEAINARTSKENNGNFDVAEGKNKGTATEANTQGRFPANLCVTGDALNGGQMTKGSGKSYNYAGREYKVDGFVKNNKPQANSNFGDSGSKSRFFDIDVWAEKHGIIQCPKPSKKEKGKSNTHSTVKPVHLMAWLVRLVSKEGGTVLDPFAGSGTTGVACKKLGRNFIGIEKEEKYLEIAQARIKKTQSIPTLGIG